MKIGVFDSGIGGLTVLKTFIKKFPNNEYIYYGDTKNLPYGNKTIEELKILSSNIIKFLLDKKVDMIVIACGTVSSNLSDYLREKYNIKILDIISPVINYLNSTNYNNIGIIATEATVKSKIFSKKVNKNIKEVACPMFVPLIENNKKEELDYYIKKYLENLRNMEIIVFGCTHYPIIRNEIKKYLNKVKLLDMSECINNIENIGTSDVKLYFTKLDENIINNINNIFDSKLYTINLIN